MEIDLKKCQIVQPDAERRDDLYRFLGGIFEVDRPLFEKLSRGELSVYHWNPYTVIQDGRIIANVSLVDLRVWMNGEVREVIGLASVATDPDYRGRGVAKYLMEYCLKQVDAKGALSVLFTDLSAVYRSSGYEVVDQGYTSLRVDDLPRGGLEAVIVDELTDASLATMERVYNREYPHYDGKVVRDSEYWSWYRWAFYLYGKNKIVLCEKKGQIFGYARVEEESDRVLISEFCCLESAGDVARALLTSVGDFARGRGAEIISLALPERHFLWSRLEAQNVPLSRETGTRRETFMVRPARERSGPNLRTLRWSLADKF